MINPILLPELRELIEAGDVKEIRDFCDAAHPEAIAEFISALEPHEIWGVLKHVEPAMRAEIFSRIDEDVRLEVATSIRRDDLAEILSEMAPDDRVDLFKDLSEEKRLAVLPALAHAEREDIRRLAAFSEGTAGAIMTSDYATLAGELSVADAISRLRLEAPDKETIYYAYVVDSNRKLLGFVSLKDLILAHPDARIADIMHEDVIAARAMEDQEVAARKLQKYDLLAIPVVDADNVIVGIITHDDAFDVIVQEQTEDMEKIMGITGSHEAGVYMKTSVWEHFKNRVVWLVLLALLGLVSGMIVQNFEGLLLQFAILATFMPMLADTGGNTGSQASTLVVRALALQEVKPRDIFRVLFKEGLVSVMLGTVLAALAFGRVFLFAGQSGVESGMPLSRIGLAVALALGLQVVSSTLIGALLPLSVAKFKFDPAVVASPALTTIVDITGLLIFFSTARIILGM